MRAVQMELCRTDIGQDREIAWLERGEGEAVLLLHGITEDHHAWDSFVTELSRDNRVIAIDLPGHGQSSPLPHYSVFSTAEAVTAFIAAEKPGSPRLVGHSLGGIVATITASLCQVGSVLNVGQALRLGSFIERVKKISTDLAGKRFSEVMNAEMASLAGPRLPEAVKAEMNRYRIPARQKVVTDMWLPIVHLTEEVVLADLLPTLARINVPYLTLHGETSGDAYAPWLGSVIRGARTEVWPWLGHCPHRVEPERFIDRVRIFHNNFWGRGSHEQRGFSGQAR